MSRKNTFFLIGALLTLVGYLLGYYQKSQISSVSAPRSTPEVDQPQKSQFFAKVIKVYDGDTIEIDGGQKVRYIGIDSAEVFPVEQCFSEEAKRENENLILGKEVRLEKDVSETDKYGRLLRYVYVGDIFVNNELTKEGFTKVMTVPPDVKYKDMFLESEKYAKENNLGLWGNCQN